MFPDLAVRPLPVGCLPVIVGEQMDRVEELMGELRALKALIEKRDLPMLLSREMAAEQMSVSVDTLDKMIRTGLIGTCRSGRLRLVPRREIEQFAESATKAREPRRSSGGRPPATRKQDVSKEDFRAALKRR